MEQQRSPEPLAAGAGRHREVVDVADAVLPALAQHDPGEPVGVLVQQPERGSQPSLSTFAACQDSSELGSLPGVAGHRLLEQRVHRRVVGAAA